MAQAKKTIYAAQRSGRRQQELRKRPAPAQEVHTGTGSRGGGLRASHEFPAGKIYAFIITGGGQDKLEAITVEDRLG